MNARPAADIWELAKEAIDALADAGHAMYDSGPADSNSALADVDRLRARLAELERPEVCQTCNGSGIAP